jgi:putative peptidoglycan lipid II flippase
VIVGTALFFALPSILPLLYPDLFTAGRGDELILLSRIVLLQPVILGVSNLAASCVQMYGRYSIFALSPVLYNVGIIIGAALFYPIWGIVGLGGGVILGAVLHLAIQAPFFFVHGLSGKMTFVSFKEVWVIARQSLPRTLSLSFSSLTILALTAYASTLYSGAITLFMFAMNLAAAPLSLIGASYSVAAFPTLSSLYQKNQYSEFRDHILIAARHILFWSMPLTSLCIVLRAHIVRAILGTGAFGWSDTRIAAATFAAIILSLAAQSIILLFVRGYYASERTRLPLIITALTAFASVTLGVGLARIYDTDGFLYYFIQDLLRLADSDNASIALLGLGMSIGNILGAATLVYIFGRTFTGVTREVAKAFRDGFVGAVFAGAGAYSTLVFFKHVYSLDSFAQIVFQGGTAALGGVITALLVLYGINNREVREIWSALHGKYQNVRIRGVEDAHN